MAPITNASVFAEALGDLVQLPAVFGAHGQVLCHGAGNGESQFFDIQTMIDEAAPAGVALAAPLDFFNSDQITDLQVFHVRADFDDLARKFVTEDIGCANQAGIEHITIAAGFVHMHVGATDAHRGDLQHHVIGFQAWIGHIVQVQTWRLPDHVSIARSAQIAFFVRSNRSRAWAPIPPTK